MNFEQLVRDMDAEIRVDVRLSLTDAIGSCVHGARPGNIDVLAGSGAAITVTIIEGNRDLGKLVRTCCMTALWWM